LRLDVVKLSDINADLKQVETEIAVLLCIES